MVDEPGAGEGSRSAAGPGADAPEPVSQGSSRGVEASPPDDLPRSRGFFGDLARSLLTRVGARCSRRVIDVLTGAVGYLEVGRWLRAHGYHVARRLPNRQAVFEQAALEFQDRPVLYLEFGVFRGDSMRFWSRLLRHPDAHLHGFDSFEGLPETWEGRARPGEFSTAGAIPLIPDPRVKFFKGWFSETLADYSPPEHEGLIINIDSDLGVSATTVLGHLRAILVPGTLLYFDEFSDPANELKAFDEFVRTSGMDFELLAASSTLEHVVFRRKSSTETRPRKR
jgi:O-methyltransferase